MRRAVGAIIAREIKRMARQRGRLVSAMVRPLIWLLVIGSGFQGLLERTGSGGYRQFLIPGLLAMVVLFGAMLASLSLVYDKESGVMRMLIIAPFPRYWIVLARTLSATLVGLVQVALMLGILLLLGYLGTVENFPLLLLGLVLTAVVCAATGMLIAVYSRALEDFAVIMNFVIFPMFFLSGALYPVSQLPPVLKLAALINPFSYGVDLLKHALLADTPSPFGADLPLAQDLAVMLGFTALALIIACVRFSQGSVIEKLARILSNPKRG